MSQLFEAIMIFCFGISWPMSIIKSLRSRTARGKSVLFILFILTGYGFGILSKLISGNITYVLVLYVLNFLMVAVDLALYYRNWTFDKAALNS